jgi:hypothetical protein
VRNDDGVLAKAPPAAVVADPGTLGGQVEPRRMTDTGFSHAPT